MSLVLSKLSQIMKVAIKLLNISFFIFVFIHPFCLKAQTTSKTVMSSFIIKGEVYCYTFSKDRRSFRFNIKAFTEVAQNTITPESKVLLKKNPIDSPPSDKKSIADTSLGKPIFAVFDKATFIKHFLNAMYFNFKSDTISTEVKDQALEVYTYIKREIEFDDDEPITAYLKLKKSNIFSMLLANSSSWYSGGLNDLLFKNRIEDVSIEFEDGAIKNILVNLIDTINKSKAEAGSEHSMQFKNLFPISMSGKSDFERFADFNLYCINCNGIKGLTRYIRLSDLLELKIVLESGKEDYSPGNSVVDLTIGSPVIGLKKEKRSKIIEMAAFSDFVGLDELQPNGLIQIEAKRKININTKFHPFRRMGLLI
jgi:hypothetical protein